MRVPGKFNAPADEDCHSGRPCSSLRVAVPAEEGTNHLLGYVLGGLRHYQSIGLGSTDTSGKIRAYINRHPNCDYVAFVMHYSVLADQEASPSIVVCAGSGATVTREVGTTAIGDILLVVFAPWDAGDSGDQEVSVTYSDCAINDLSIFDVVRTSLGDGDHRVEHVDGDHRRIGLTTERCIASSATAGPNGIVQEIIDAWDSYCPQVFSWWSEAPLTTNAGDWTDPFGGVQFVHKARQKKTATSTTDSRWRIYSCCDAGVTYQWRVKSGSDTVTSGSLTNTSAAWQTMLPNLALDNTADDQFTIEMIVVDGVGDIYIYGGSGIEGYLPADA